MIVESKQKVAVASGGSAPSRQMLSTMSRDIPERDWKAFREIHPVARARFCERVLSEIASASSAPG